MTTQKPLIPSMMFFFSASWAIILGFLFRFRILPFLQADTILSGGKQVPTEQFAHFVSIFFWGAAALVIALGIVGILTLNEPRRATSLHCPASSSGCSGLFTASPPLHHPSPNNALQRTQAGGGAFSEPMP